MIHGSHSFGLMAGVTLGFVMYRAAPSCDFSLFRSFVLSGRVRLMSAAGFGQGKQQPTGVYTFFGVCVCVRYLSSSRLSGDDSQNPIWPICDRPVH